MAFIRLLFQSSLGHAEEVGFTDSSQIGKLTFTGITGVAVDANGNRIVNVATPVAATDAVNKQYVDDVILEPDDIGHVLFARDALLFSSSSPMTTNTNGWLVNNSGLLLVV